MVWRLHFLNIAHTRSICSKPQSRSFQKSRVRLAHALGPSKSWVIWSRRWPFPRRQLEAFWGWVAICWVAQSQVLEPQLWCNKQVAVWLPQRVNLGNALAPLTLSKKWISRPWSILASLLQWQQGSRLKVCRFQVWRFQVQGLTPSPRAFTPSCKPGRRLRRTWSSMIQFPRLACLATTEAPWATSHGATWLWPAAAQGFSSPRLLSIHLPCRQSSLWMSGSWSGHPIVWRSTSMLGTSPRGWDWMGRLPSMPWPLVLTWHQTNTMHPPSCTTKQCGPSTSFGFSNWFTCLMFLTLFEPILNFFQQHTCKEPSGTCSSCPQRAGPCAFEGCCRDSFGWCSAVGLPNCTSMGAPFDQGWDGLGPCFGHVG